ncbi:MAG TPA: hypothetical protein DCF68_06700 [Cyanothece sp. UBA12306]|nr:hypothetical protein [Cyanothece sp. UBA12306]
MIATLESYLNQSEKSAIAYQLLGEAYLKIGLLNQAKTAYEQVILLSDGKASSIRATTQEGLGLIAQSQGDQETALQLDQKARKNYKILENQTKIQLIEHRIQELTNKVK